MPPTNGRFPGSAIAIIIISIIIILLIASLFIWHAIKARRAERGKSPLPLNANIIQVRDCITRSSSPAVSNENLPLDNILSQFPLPLPSHPHPATTQVSLASKEVPFYLSPSQSSLHSTTLLNSSSTTSLPKPPPEAHAPPPKRPSLTRPRLSRYLTDLQERFTPSVHERTEAEVEAMFQGRQLKMLPRPKREVEEVMVVPARIYDLDGKRLH